MQFFAFLTALMATTATAAAVTKPMHFEINKRQLVPVPDDCEDKDAYQMCAVRNSYICWNPFFGQAAICAYYCEGCCGNKDGNCE